MRRPVLATLAVAALALLHGTAQAQSCQGGAYLNPQFFRGEASHQIAIAEQELHSFMQRSGLPASPMYTIKRVDDVTANTRAPYCWIYGNPVVGLLSGYKPVVINAEPVQPAVVVLSAPVAGAAGATAVHLKSLPPAEQRTVLEQLTRSRCMGTVTSVESAIAKKEGLCAFVEDVAVQAALGQQGLIARAAFEWEEKSWVGFVTREAAGLQTSLRGLAGKTERLQSARLVVVPTQATSMGFGLWVHPSLPEAAARKAQAAFQQLTEPSRPLAVALDLGPNHRFIVPSAEQLAKLGEDLGIRR